MPRSMVVKRIWEIVKERDLFVSALELGAEGTELVKYNFVTENLLRSL